MFRFTMFFTSDRNSWSESHLLTQDTNRAQAESRAVELAQARSGLLGQNARIIGVRVGVPGVARQARLVDMGSPTLEAPNFTNPVEGQTTADSPHVAVLVRASGLDTEGTLHQSRMFLSGVPDSLITVRGSSPELKIDPAWSKRWTTYSNLLLNYSCGFKGTTRLVPVQVAGVVLNNAPPGLIGVTFEQITPMPAVGDFVTIGGFVPGTAFAKPFKGRYQVAQIVAPTSPATLYTMYLMGTTGIDPLGFTQLGYFQQKDTTVIAYQSLVPATATHRDRGGSYGLQRGRSRKTRR